MSAARKKRRPSRHARGYTNAHVAATGNSNHSSPPAKSAAAAATS